MRLLVTLLFSAATAFGFAKHLQPCCGRCPAGAIDCLASCRSNCGDLAQCAGAGQGAYASACQRGCFKLGVHEQSSMFTPSSQCETACVTAAVGLCQASGGCSRDYGCVLDDCEAQAAANCNTMKLRELMQGKKDAASQLVEMASQFAPGLAPALEALMPYMIGSRVMPMPGMQMPQQVMQQQPGVTQQHMVMVNQQQKPQAKPMMPQQMQQPPVYYDQGIMY